MNANIHKLIEAALQVDELAPLAVAALVEWAHVTGVLHVMAHVDPGAIQAGFVAAQKCEGVHTAAPDSTQPLH